MTMTSRWLTLLATAGACVGLISLGNACGSDDTSDNSGNNTSTTTVGPGGGGNNAGGGDQGGGGGNVGGNGQGGMTSSIPTEADCSPATGTPGGLTLTEVANVSGDAVMVAAPWGDNERLFIVEQEGRIQLLKNDTVTQFLDISGIVNAGGERGLLGLAFHPDYVTNGRFFVHYSDNSGGDTVIAEFRRDPANEDVADPTPVVATILEVDQPFPNHNGGSIEFSPVDGYLYIGLGDGGSGNDPQGFGQDKTSLLATLVRIDVSDTSGNPPYAIPDGNITDGAPEIFDWGLRNPYRFSFDICTGDRYIGDVGQDCYAEIDVAPSTDGPQNWGWKIMEGAHCRGQGCNATPPNGCDDTGMTPPAIEYLHGEGGQCDSVTGGVVYRGTAIPWLRGAYLYADFCDGRSWMFRWENGVVSDQQSLTQLLGTGGVNIAAFGQDNKGEVYVVAYDGRILRIDPS